VCSPAVVDPAGRAIVHADEPTAASSGCAIGFADAASTYDVLMRVPIQEFAKCPAPWTMSESPRQWRRAGVRTG